MSVFVDTSAFLALLDADDAHHQDARRAWTRLAEEPASLSTTSYVVVETVAVVQHRLGLAAVRALVREVLPVVDVLFVDAVTHEAALTALMTSARRRLSLVDCVSFGVMRQAGLRRAFAYDRHFDEMGFTLADTPGRPDRLYPSD